jgi:thiol-disulfide isomerase/thioredoxin
MRYAMALALAVILGLALAAFMPDGESPQERPQSSPPTQAEPPAERPTFTEDYDLAMAEKGRKVILVFGADWCPHCSVLEEHLKGMNLEGYLVCSVDVDSRKDLASEYRIKVLPTSVVLLEGKEVSRTKGFSKASYDRWVESNR